MAVYLKLGDFAIISSWFCCAILDWNPVTVLGEKSIAIVG